MNLQMLSLHYQNALIVDFNGDVEGYGPQLSFVVTLVSHMESFGMTLDERTRKILSYQDISTLQSWSVDVLKAVQGSMNTIRQYQPLYANFPHEYLSFINAVDYVPSPYASLSMLGYRTNVQNSKRYMKPLRVVGSVPRTSLLKIFNDLLTMPASWSADDRENVMALLAIYPLTVQQLDAISNRENLADILAVCGWQQLRPSRPVVTDALRVAQKWSGGTTTLSNIVPFKLSRQQRRDVMDYLEYACQRHPEGMLDSMLPRRGLWLTFAKHLHVFEFKKHSSCHHVFNELRNNKQLRSLNAKVEMAFEVNDIDNVVKHLTQRPGVFARRLLQILRHDATDIVTVLSAFKNVIHTIPTTVLISLLDSIHQSSMHNMISTKKGCVKVYARETCPVPMDAVAMLEVMIESDLKRRFSTLSPLGRVYIDDVLKHIPVPKVHRHSNRSLQTLPRGSRLMLPETESFRAFVFWSENANGLTSNGNIDLDLNAQFFDDNYHYRGLSSFHSDFCGARHSGDVREAPNGAAEFIDITYDQVPVGTRYVMLTLTSFSGQRYRDLPACSMGYSLVTGDEAFDITTAERMVDVANDCRAIVMCVLDLRDRTLLWLDAGIGDYQMPEKSPYELILKAATSMHYISLYDVLTWHVESRGERVMTIDADNPPDVIYDIETAYDTLKIQNEWLSTGTT